MVIASLDRPGPRFPNLDGAILGASDHPLPFAVECNTGDVACVALEGQERVRIRGLDVIELDGMMPCCSQETLVG